MHSIIFKRNAHDAMQIPLPNSKIAYEMNARRREKKEKERERGGGEKEKDWMAVEEKWYCNQLEAKLSNEAHKKL